MNPDKPTAGPGGKAGQKAKRRKLLIYGGIAAAILLVLLLRRQSSQDQQPAQQPGQPPATPSDPTLGGGASGIDPSGQLANIDSELNTISQALANGKTNQTTPGGLPGDLSSFIAAELTALGIYKAGERNGGPGGHKNNHHQPKPNPHHNRPPKPPHGRAWQPGERHPRNQPDAHHTGGGRGGMTNGGHVTPNRPKSRAYHRHG